MPRYVVERTFPGGLALPTNVAGADLGYYHCAPPGKPSVADLIAGTDVPTIVLRVFNDAPTDAERTLAGIERLRRADLYAGEPCPQDNLVTWDLLPFGYYACHNFDT